MASKFQISSGYKILIADTVEISRTVYRLTFSFLLIIYS